MYIAKVVPKQLFIIKIDEYMDKMVTEQFLKSIIRESIEEIMTGNYINQGIDKQWGDPNSPLRQFGDEWLKMTMDLCNKHNSTINPQELIALMKPIVIKIMMKKQ